MCEPTGKSHSEQVCVVNNLTLIVAWSAAEVARYLEVYKSYEHKPPDLIRERVAQDYNSILTSALTSVKGVNKTDVTMLSSTFGVRALLFDAKTFYLQIRTDAKRMRTSVVV